MSELIQVKELLTDFLEAHEEIAREYQIDNRQYREGLQDAIRMVNKMIDNENERMSKYYDVK